MGVKHWKMTLGVVGFLFAGLLGCSEEKAERLLNKETYSFIGIYENQHNGDLLKFSDAEITVTKERGETYTKPFEVDGDNLIIQMRNNSKEKRDDIVMRIHGDNELLTCSVCAKYQLSSTWVKRFD
ncbi:hypothetical protein [Vibrio ouci]|uniref:Lipoprotein n=1 Tax=Vibrio ouci TaxID=2499078 RepID=A0A4Y8WK38_9VIBR|nr:hypothetical protein [Vibrio ouci]TFH93184.1 hypothetical protein ELS82_01890 [Vibrio ouci]